MTIREVPAIESKAKFDKLHFVCAKENKKCCFFKGSCRLEEGPEIDPAYGRCLSKVVKS